MEANLFTAVTQSIRKGLALAPETSVQGRKYVVEILDFNTWQVWVTVTDQEGVTETLQITVSPGS